MPALTAVRIHVSVFDNEDAESSYVSYTLQNTPFYFRPVWSDLSEKANYSQYQIIWNFGDGTKYVGPSATHYYTYPGVYNFSATFFDKNGDPSTTNTTTDTVTSTTLSSVYNGIDFDVYTITETTPLVTSLTAINAVPDVVIFDLIQPNTDTGVLLLPAGEQSPDLNISRYNSWQNNRFLSDVGYTINLYASGSQSNYLPLSTYYSNKWSHLKIYYSFIERYLTDEGIISTKLIDSTTTTSVSVYAEKYKLPDSWNIGLNFYNYPKEETVFAGTTGTATTENKSIRYVDQKPCKVSLITPNTLIFLYAHPDTSRYPDIGSFLQGLYPSISFPEYGYLNTPIQTQYLRTVFNPAESLAITSNGITVEGGEQTVGPLSGQLLHSFNIYPIKWVNQEIPFFITFKDRNNYTTKCYPPITGFKFDGTLPTEINTVSLSLHKIASPDISSTFTLVSSYRIEQAIFSKNLRAPSFEKSGSYFAGTLKIPFETTVVTICAAALIQDEPRYNLGFSFGFASQPGIKNIKRFRRKPIFSHCDSEDLTISFQGESVTYSTTQSASMPVSVAPLKSFNIGDVDKVWIADSDTDRILVYTATGALLNTFELSAMPIYTTSVTLPKILDLRGALKSSSPSSIAIDSKGNAWISLYDAVSCIKISNDTLQVEAYAVPSLFNEQYTVISSYLALSAQHQGYSGENSLLPSCIDTDRSDNVWVGYSHPVSGFLIKYNKNGQQQNIISLPLLHSVQEIVCDRDNNVYAIVVDLSKSNPDPYNRIDKIYKWNPDGILENNFPKNITAVGNLTVDLKQNAWVSHGYSKISRITPTGDIAEFEIGSQVPLNEYFQPIGGIAVDLEGFLWIIQNYQGKMLFYPINRPEQLDLLDLEYSNLPNIEVVLPEGAQAFYKTMGDWTGARWINKYNNTIVAPPRMIYGSSNLFSILNDSPTINKINENFDQTEQFKKYILQEGLFNKPALLDNFLGQIVGNYNSPPETLGKTIYEKIANFVSNNSDPDVCNIDALQSLYQQYGLTFYNFTQQYPGRLKRAVDLLSINKSKLFGSPNLYSSNFGLTSYGYNLGKNLGPEIPIETGKFKVGYPIVAYEKFSEEYKLITNTLIPETNGIPVISGNYYPLSCVNYNWGWGLVTGTREQSGTAIEPYYIFYDYNPYYPKNMVDGVIDFSNPLTTITPQNSSYEEWIQYGGFMERVLSRAFAEGLSII